MAGPAKPQQPEVSPYLYQFLLSGVPGAKKETKKTTASLRPGAVKSGLFAPNTVQDSDAFKHLQTIANGRASTRADADAMYGIKLQKKQQALLEEQLKQIAARNSGNPGYNPNLPNYPNYPGYRPGGNGNNNNNGIVLPPVMASPADRKNADLNQWACNTYGKCPPGYFQESHIRPPKPSEDHESIWDKIKGMFG